MMRRSSVLGPAGLGGISGPWATPGRFVLDGGLPKWIAEGRAVEAGWVQPPHGEFKAHPERRSGP